MVRAVKGGNVTVTKPLIWLSILVLMIILTTPAFAQKVKDGKDTLDHISFVRSGTWLTMNGSEYSALGAEVPSAMVSDIESLKANTGIPWIANIDRITGKPSLIEGGTPWIPGTGLNNNLKPEDFGITTLQAQRNEVPLETADLIARAFLKEYPNLFNVNADDLELAKDASGPRLDYLYNVNYRWTYYGLPVENAWLNFHLNSGNLVMFGATYICDSIKKLDPTPTLNSDTAFELLWSYIGEKPSPNDTIVEPARLIVQPFSTSAVINGSSYTFGQGMEYRLVYVIVFHRDGVMGTWEGRIDAHTGEIISFQDVNAYGQIQGGVYKTDKNPTQTESVMPFPYANYSGTTSYADVSGAYTGTTGTSTMRGRTGSTGNVGGVVITDSCGSISLASDGTGLINFSTHSTSSTDCTTPGVGGSGNTHSSRTQYWNVSQIKIKAYTYLSGNTWLQGLLTDKVNLNQTCNAYWDGSTVNFFKSSSYCGNTGELPGVSLHEWAHGMDTNDGNGFSPDSGTGEVYGDTSAMLQTHQSCMGGGFWKSYNPGCGTPPSQSSSYHNCDGYGNCCTDCSGVREADYAKHSSATMATPLNFNQSCPTATCKGPCGKECHCENAPGIQANWDLCVRVFPTLYGMDSTTAWQYLDQYWYASAPNRLAAFVCGNNTSTGTGNLFNQYRVIDDCDGVLTNGTPHAAGIWQALGTNHQIGNSSAVNTDNNCGCTSLSTPALSGTAGTGSVNLTWAAVTGAASYDVYKNETSCDSGFTLVGNTTSLNYTVSPLTNGVTYYFRIQANGTGSCPPSAMSNCVTLTPTSCTLPSAPGSVTATGACSYNTITWGTVSGATSYNVLRGTTCGTVLNTFTGVTSPYNDTTAVAGTTYNYWVVALNACGTSANSSCATATRLTVPAAPASVTATGDCTYNTITWGTVSGATSYNVLRGTTCGTVLNTFTGVTSPYNDTTAVAGTTYNYWVVAVNSCGNSANSSCATATRLSGAPSAPGSVTATAACSYNTITWGTVSGATSYNVLRGTTCGTVVTTFTGVTSPYNDTTAVAGTTYNYWVVAVNSCGTSANSSCATAARLTVPSAPGSVTATAACSYNTITWGTVTGATSYNVLRGTTCGTVVTTFTGVTSPYNDTTAVAGTTYNYWVVAVNSCGNSANSSCATAARLVSPTPTITGSNANVCPAITVALSTESGMSNYQWYLGGTPIGGATAYQYTATATGSYTVSYTGANGCSGTSAAHAVTISACAPNIVYSTHGTLTQVTGNGDAYYDLGEKWSVPITLTNNGNIPANNVTAVFAGNDIEVCSPTGSFGTIAVGGTSSVTFQFVISTSATCGGSIGFDVTTKTSTELTPAGTDETDVFTITVGSGSGSGTVTLFGPDDTPATSGLWAGSISSQTATHCSHTTAYNRVGNNNNTYLASDISTLGYTNIHVIFDAGVTATGQTITLEYSTNSGGSYTSAGWSYTGSTTWQCSQNVTLPSSCENISTLRIRFRTNNVGTTSRGMMDNISITGDAPGYDCSYVGSGTCVECVTPGTPVVDSVTDLSACSQSGVQVNYTANTPYTTHDLYVDGSLTVSDYASGATYNPGNTSSHSYVVRAINGLDTCYAESSSTAGTDANNTPGAPSVTAVTDVSACAQSGVQIVFTAGTPAGSSYDLYDNGSIAVNGYTSGETYNPGNTSSHSYTIYAISGTCTSPVSNSMSGTDANDTPTPTITGDSTNTCPSLTVTLYTESGASSYQWYIGGSPIGGANAYQYIAAASGTYTVSYTNGSGCSGTSAGHAVTINSCDVVPGEVAVGADFTWTGQVISWTADSNATSGYRVYRGLSANLSGLCDATTDFCLRNDAAATSLDVTGDDPSGQSGRCFYYLITGYSGAGEGPAGTATCGTRQVNSSGGCL